MPQAELLNAPATGNADRAATAKVVLLANILPPHQRPVYLELARRVGKLTVLLSSPLGQHGIDNTSWDSLDVRIQKTLTFRGPQKHPHGFDDRIELHIPWRTMSELKALQPDIVLANESGIRSLLSYFYAHGRARVPLIVTVGMTEHTERGRGRMRYHLRRWLLSRADAVGVNGRGTARYVTALGIPTQKQFHYPYAAFKGATSDAPATRDERTAHRLLYVGQFIDRKGLIPFTKALGAWAAAHLTRKIEFTLIGAGPLEQTLREFPLPENVKLTFPGRSKPEQMGEHYENAGILVLPTLADEWGLTVNEAMHSGLPVLGSIYGHAVEELCVDGTTGWTFRTDVHDEIVAAIDAAMTTTPAALDVMREAARKKVEYLTPAYVVDQLVGQINKLLSRTYR